MENQNTNNQNPQTQPEQNVVTIHSEKPARNGHFILFAVMGFAAVVASAGIMVFMNDNKPTTSASYREDASLNNVITEPTNTPVPTEVLTEIERDQQEIDNIDIEDADAEISTLDGELNQL